MTTLISFLGTGDRKKGYQKTTYLFDESIEITTQYIGLALIERTQPERMIILGTTGSMWDVFFEHQDSGSDDQLLQLMDAIDTQALTQEQLNPFSERLSKKLNVRVDCIIIPHARNAQEQVEILERLASILKIGETVSIDVTHGFRHLPMLALVAARFLQKTKNICTQHLYYGDLQMSVDRKAPVLVLDSMLHMLDWVDALSSYDKGGDYSVFADLLQKDGLAPNMADQLRQAAFLSVPPIQVKQPKKLALCLTHSKK
jgi:CRISPR-associated Csx2 family protein